MFFNRKGHTKWMIKELGLSLQEMIREDNPDKVIQMDTQEIDVVEEVSQYLLLSRDGKGVSTPGRKPKRKKHYNKGKTPGCLEGTPQTAGGQKVSKKITEDFIWGGLCPEFLQYYYSIGLRKKQELYMISQAIRCKSDVNLPPITRCILNNTFRLPFPCYMSGQQCFSGRLLLGMILQPAI